MPAWPANPDAGPVIGKQDRDMKADTQRALGDQWASALTLPPDRRGRPARSWRYQGWSTVDAPDRRQMSAMRIVSLQTPVVAGTGLVSPGAPGRRERNGMGESC
jgi:hypothetical protein